MGENKKYLIIGFITWKSSDKTTDHEIKYYARFDANVPDICVPEQPDEMPNEEWNNSYEKIKSLCFDIARAKIKKEKNRK